MLDQRRSPYRRSGRGALEVRLVRLSAYSAATAALASKGPGAAKPQTISEWGARMCGLGTRPASRPTARTAGRDLTHAPSDRRMSPRQPYPKICQPFARCSNHGVPAMQTSVYAMAETVVAVFCALLLVPSSPRRPHRMGGLPMTTCLCGTVRCLRRLFRHVRACARHGVLHNFASAEA